jgi:hypothetical protein
MDEQKKLSALDRACQIGDFHARQSIQHANEAKALRTAIQQALARLRSGRPAQARSILEYVLEQLNRKRR